MKQKVKTVVIDTPEHFELHFKPAGIGTRFLAYLIDRLIQFGLIAGLAMGAILSLVAMNSLDVLPDLPNKIRSLIGPWFIAAALLVYGIITIGYFILFEYLWSGTTPGKRTQRIRVIRKDGRPITFLDSAVRNILRFVDILAEVYPLGVVVMFMDSRNRRLGDLTAGTLVVIDQQLGPPSLEEGSPGDKPQVFGARSSPMELSPTGYRLVSRFLARRVDMDPEPRAQLAWKIYEQTRGNSDGVPRNGPAPEKELERAASLYREKTRIL